MSARPLPLWVLAWLTAMAACATDVAGGGAHSPANPSIANARTERVPLRDDSGDDGSGPANAELFTPTATAPTATAPNVPAPPERWGGRSTVGSAPQSPTPGRLIDLDVRGADIVDVCRLLAEVGGVNIVVADDVRGLVTVRMKRVPWDRALDAIVEAKGLRVVREGDIILVKSAAR